MNRFKLITLLFLLNFSVQAQMFINNDTLYGNEWINYDQSYFKIKVAEDGFYKVDFQQLDAAGVFAGSTPNGANFQLFSHGEEVPIRVSQTGAFNNGDFIIFYGEKNKSKLDQHLFLDSSFITNLEYSTFTDTAAYFLTWNTTTNHKRYQSIENNLTNPPVVEPYCWREVVTSYFNAYDQGKKYNNSYNSRYAGFDLGEGFAGSFSVNHSINVATPLVYSSGPTSQVNVRYRTEIGDHHLTLAINNTAQVDTSFSGAAVNEHFINIATASLSSSNNVTLTGLSGSDDKYGIGTIRIRYPHQLDFEGSSSFQFQLNASSVSKYLEISNFNSTGNAPVLFDLTNDLFVETTLENNLVKVVLPPSATNRTLILLITEAYKSIIKIEERSFVNYNDVAGDYLIISHPALMVDANENNYVQDYADYRSSSTGGGFDVVVADINQVYDQFAYGIDRHEISVRNFTHFAVKNWGLDYLFLVGKGVYYQAMRPANSTWYNRFFVPSFGAPQSDHLFATNSTSNIPLIPVGRLAAQSPKQVDIYLRKVIEFESKGMLTQTIEDKAWMKRVIHLGGGDSGIQDFIKNELEEVENTLEDGTFGAKVYPFYKTSSDVLQEAPSDQITNLINMGVSMITFFGHSAPTVLDFDLEAPENYNNYGKYPLVYTIGCHTNRLFEFSETISEKWVFAEDKGAIAFLGATWETTLPNLSNYAKFFYANLATNHYGDRLGNILRETIIDLDLNSSFYSEQLKQVLILHGDPALRLNPHEGPDYLVDASSVATQPTLINMQMDSFLMHLNIANIGSSVADSFLVKVEHELPNGTILPSVEGMVKSPKYEGAMDLIVSVPKNEILGFNKLIITLDASDSIPEAPTPLAEMNNVYKHTFYVVANDAFPIYPYEYSIVSDPNPVLKASTANAFAARQKYYLEIDTTLYFNSSLKQNTIIEQSGGVISWTPTIPYSENTVYYWRISIDSTLTTGYGFNWHESSFIYKAGSSTGWNQSHFFQFTKENKLEDIILGEPDRKMKYGSKINELKIKFAAHPIIPWQENTSVLNNEILTQFRLCLDSSGIAFAVFDPFTVEPWINSHQGGLDGEYGSYLCQNNYDWFIYVYRTNTLENREKAINFLENIVPDNSYVLAYTLQKEGTNYDPELWAMDSINNSFQKNLFQVLEEQGAQKIRQTIVKGGPYYYFYRKNNPIVEDIGPLEMIADTDTTVIEGTILFKSPLDRGNIFSTKIGPAKEWQSLQWDMEQYDPLSDKVSLNIYGIDSQNQEHLLHTGVSVYDTTLNHINATVYPFLRLAYESKDSTLRSSPHLDFWRVLYDPVPESALRPDLKLAFQSDTITQGEPLSLDIAVENISEIDMDSLLVHYTVVDQNNTPYLTGSRIAPLLKGDTLMAHLEFNTKNITTPYNQLFVEVNPDEDQPEQYHFNNIGVLPFYLIRDVRNPLLDVTFDGVHILDGDIVSANTIISISLRDENQYLTLSDTSLFKISLIHPDESSPKRIYLSDPSVSFIPAEEGNLNKENKAKVEIRNFFNVDGIYELHASAKDNTGNNAGENDYKIRFEVINKAMISNVFNYPNPFSTSTQFVFTLTGAAVPDFMKIQIMTTSGKVIREITQDELGAIHVGKNITEYRWDGTDQYGDRLANGVYLYRVVTRKADGALYEDYDTKTNQYFNNGIGKMVIIR